MVDRVIDFFIHHPDLAIIIITCIIQIAPIKINPWSALFTWIGNKLNHNLSDKIDAVEEKVDCIDREVRDERVQNKRWSILGFANSCRRDVPHTKEEWDHCIEELEWYENYCEKNDVVNGVIEENARWLRKRYQKHLDNNDFLNN